MATTWVPPRLGAECYAARRRHILWIIRNHPEAEIAGLSQTTIDPSGHPLADAEGYAQAKEAWLQQVETHKKTPAVIANAVTFFATPDKELAVTMLERGLALEPADRKWSGQLGYVYATAILGMTGKNQNGLPTRAIRGKHAELLPESPESTRGIVQRRRRGSAGYTLYMQGSMLHSSGKVVPDPTILAEQLLQKAHSLAPKEPQWTSSLCSCTA